MGQGYHVPRRFGKIHRDRLECFFAEEIGAKVAVVLGGGYAGVAHDLG
jgi:hypothetical protein